MINFTSYKKLAESLFKIKTFKSLKEAMEYFLNVKNCKSPKQVMRSFFGIKNFNTVMASFSELKTLRVVREWWSSLLFIRNSFFFSGHASLSFHSMIKFLGTTFSLSVPTELL